MTAPVGQLLPGTDLVGVAWLKRNANFAPNGIGVSTTLPKNDSAALRAGFVTATIVGGQKMVDLPFRQPVISISAWAMPLPGSSKTPWHRADAIMQWIVQQTDDPAHMGVVVSGFPAGYASARVRTVVPVGEALRVPNDPAGAARVDLDVTLNWSL